MGDAFASKQASGPLRVTGAVVLVTVSELSVSWRLSAKLPEFAGRDVLGGYGGRR